jgi:transposase
MRPKGSSAALEQRRRDAVAMLRQGSKPAEVAKALRVSLVSVGRWRKAAAEGGAKALVAKPHPGRPPKLCVEERRQLIGLLKQGPVRHGYGTQLWTLGRIAEVIELHFGVSYHPSQVWRILLSLDWTWQKPQRRARERDEAAIERWRRLDWPRIKKGGKQRPERAVAGRNRTDAPAAGETYLGPQRGAAGDVLLGLP